MKINLSLNLALVFVIVNLLASSVLAATKSEFDLDQGSGSVEFHATGHPSALKIVGKGDKALGHFSVDGEFITGDAAFHLSSLDTGNQTRNSHMKEKYLEVGKFPDAKFLLAKMKIPGELVAGVSMKEVPFAGTLSLHGVEKPIKGTVSIERTGTQVSIRAQFGIRIGDYGIVTPSFLGITMADDVQISVQQTVSAAAHNKNTASK